MPELGTLPNIIADKLPATDYNYSRYQDIGAPERVTPMTDALVIAMDLFTQLPLSDQREILALAAALASQK